MPDGVARLSAGEHEVLAPERTGNPALHRFLDCVGQRRLAGEAGAAAALPEDGGLAERALQAQLDNQQAAQALEGVAAIFKVATEDAEEVEMAEAWPTPKAVGFHQPVQDFEKALGWDPDLAFEGMAAAIRGLVEGVDGVTRCCSQSVVLPQARLSLLGWPHKKSWRTRVAGARVTSWRSSASRGCAAPRACCPSCPVTSRPSTRC